MPFEFNGYQMARGDRLDAAHLCHAAAHGGRASLAPFSPGTVALPGFPPPKLPCSWPELVAPSAPLALLALLAFLLFRMFL